MTLKEKINKDFIKAFKEKDTITKNLLSVIKSEIQTLEKGKNSSNDLNDEEVTRVLNKLVKSLKETISISDDEKSKNELVIVESYLPKQMSQEEITEKVQSLIDSGAKNMGDFMKSFAGLPVDRKLVNQIVNQMTAV
jgi:uncharacterized protein YqeY